MMSILLFDGPSRIHLLPFVYTKPIGELRCGIFTFSEKWERSGYNVNGFITEDYLQKKYAGHSNGQERCIYGAVSPTPSFLKDLETLKPGQALWEGDLLLAFYPDTDTPQNTLLHPERLQKIQVSDPEELICITRTWHLFSLNGRAIAQDFSFKKQWDESQTPSSTNRIIGNGEIYIHPTAVVEGAMLNASSGPIYIGPEAEVMEGSVVRGSLALCDHATLKLSTKIYGPTTIGPHSKAGGELNNVVIQAYSNKGHDGFLGNAVIGEWVNIGADSNNSNLKNNYEEVKAWSYASQRFEKTGLTFCGLMMGDHSKCGINTMFNTGTVVGIAANIFGSGFPRNFVPSFSWGGAQGFETFRLPKVLEMAKQMMGRRNVPLTDIDIEILTHIFSITSSERSWENSTKHA